MTRFALVRRTVMVLAGLAAAFPAFAQTSGQPLRLILPVGPGSGVDTIVRTFGNAFSKELGQPVVIENQPGAGGVIGTQALAKAAPDGRTLGVVSNNHVVFPSVYKNLPFDPIEDITPISVIGETPFVLAANPAKVPASSVKDVIAAVKAKPADFNYGSSGSGTILHLAAAMFFVGRGVLGASQSLNARSSNGVISASVVSPAMKMRALSGRSQVPLKPTRSSRVIEAIDSSVPEPVNGTPYA